MALILLCETELESATCLLATLAAEGHAVEAFDSGFDVVKRAIETEPDLVMVAEHAPVFDGYETCMRLRQDPTLPPDLPILIVVSERPDPRRLEAARATGALVRGRPADELRSLLVDLLGPLANPRG